MTQLQREQRVSAASPGVKNDDDDDAEEEEDDDDDNRLLDLSYQGFPLLLLTAAEKKKQSR